MLLHSKRRLAKLIADEFEEVITIGERHLAVEFLSDLTTHIGIKIRVLTRSELRPLSFRLWFIDVEMDAELERDDRSNNRILVYRHVFLVEAMTASSVTTSTTSSA